MRYNVITHNGQEPRNLNRAAAIKHFCLHCQNWSLSRVQACNQTNCRLHPYRTGEKNPCNRSLVNSAGLSIAAYCRECRGVKSIGRAQTLADIAIANLPVCHCDGFTCPLYPWRYGSGGPDTSAELMETPEEYVIRKRKEQEGHERCRRRRQQERLDLCIKRKKLKKQAR